ncbi:MAG: hypothetical protein ACREB9_00710 [Thermoplasmata archaeon]
MFDTAPGSLGDLAKTTAIEGITGAVALIANDKFIATPLNGVIGTSAGKYAGPVEGFIAGLLFRYIGEKANKPELGRAAAATVFGYKVAAAFSTGPLDPPMTHGTIGASATRASSRPWQSLSPVNLGWVGGGV